MSTNSQAKRYPFKAYVEQKAMRRQKVIKTTVGELIVAVTDEVMPFVGNPSVLNKVVCWILNDVLARHRLRVPSASRRRYPSQLAKALY
jgi:hypothetical protein